MVWPFAPARVMPNENTTLAGDSHALPESTVAGKRIQLGLSLPISFVCCSLFFGIQGHANPTHITQTISHSKPSVWITSRAANTVGNFRSGFRSVAIDHDLDGIDDAIDVDTDNDTIPDVYEGTSDADNDGIPNYLDLDSDNDSSSDLTEAILDRQLRLTLDANNDGRIDASVSVGRNGLADAVELVTDATNLARPLPDHDNDRVPNFLALDSDNDGLSDRIESLNFQDFLTATIADLQDLNGDGYDDRYSLSSIEFYDHDEDGLENSLDIDSDGDGLSDLLETANADRDNNGRVDQFIDQDLNGYQDSLQGSPITMRDQDNDGNPDHLDLDKNDNGVFDITEAGFEDLDNNGKKDETAQGPEINSSLTTPSTTDDANENKLVLITGLNGNAHGGCSVSTSTASTDPTLPLILVLAATYLRVTSTRRFKARP